MTPTALRDRPTRSIEIDGKPVQVKVRESTRARTTRILVGARRPLEIIVPAGTLDREVDDLLAARRSWIAEKLAVVAAAHARPAKLGLDRPGVAWLAGEPVPVEARDRARALAELRDGRLIVRGTSANARRLAVERWYRRQARHRIGEAAVREADRLGLGFRSVSVRDQQTRWGSCSRAGNLSFNWRLVMAPAEVLDYVVTHELCHLTVPNHSKVFWRQLEVACAGWQERAAWLRDHGAELRSYTVGS